jgi:hypothetical protein
MTSIRNDLMELAVSDDCAVVVLTDRRTGSRWLLDPATVLADGSGRDRLCFGANRKRGSGNIVDETTPAPVAFVEGCVREQGDRALRVTLRGPAGQLVVDYELLHGSCRVTALAGESTVTSCSLPGAFRPEGADAPAVALPKNQGIWHRGTGGPFCFQMVREGHGGWSMPFAAAVGRRDALLHIIDTEHDARIWFEKTDAGQVRLTSLQDPTRGRLSYNRSVLLRFVEPNVTAICQAYRRYVRERGHFVSWDEKIEKRPNLRRLFGALMCFIGYCQDEDLDYAAAFRRLKAMGFDRAFVYPLSIGNAVRDFLMGGRPPVDVRRHLGLLDELGYLAASWMWVEDVPEDPADLMLSADGKSMFGWQIDDRRWFRSCPVRQLALANRIQDERMGGNTGEHFDVTASRQLLECYHPDHPLDRRDDAIWRRKVLETGTARGGVISSEGFWGFAAPSYDIGSVKIPVPVHADWYTVPMTSLVYHDSCVHDWWEVDNYNNPHHRTQGGRDKGYFPMGGGFQASQACQDALAGWPPNVMPFGSQYAFVAGQMPATELYRYTLDSPEVVEALKLALPVAQLHGRIGRLACVKHETLAQDGSVQATTFADGTRVMANYSNEPREVAGVGLLRPASWQAVV